MSDGRKVVYEYGDDFPIRLAQLRNLETLSLSKILDLLLEIDKELQDFSRSDPALTKTQWVRVDRIHNILEGVLYE